MPTWSLVAIFFFFFLLFLIPAPKKSRRRDSVPKSGARDMSGLHSHDYAKDRTSDIFNAPEYSKFPCNIHHDLLK